MHPLETLSFTDRVAKRAQYEAFEFSIVPEGVRVRNCSHEQPSEHEYIVTIQVGQPVSCECPADDRFDGACKHRVAVAIRKPVIKAAATKDVVADGGTLQSDPSENLVPEEQEDSEECDCATLPDDFPCWECVRAGKRQLPDDAADDKEPEEGQQCRSRQKPFSDVTDTAAPR
jgi:hypothetical protein